MEIIRYAHQKNTTTYVIVNRVIPETQLKDALLLIGVLLVHVETELNVRTPEIVRSAPAPQDM